MQHTIEKKSPFLVNINIKESGKEFDKVFKQTITQWKEKADIKGWRKGSEIPDDVFFKNYSIEHIQQDAIEQLIDKLYRKVLSKAEVIPVAPADVKEMKSLSPFEVDLEVEVLPEAEIDEKKMKKIKLKKTPVEVANTEVDEAIAQIETRFTTYEAAAEGATIEMGDRVLLDTQGFDGKGGAEIVETKVSAFSLLIGSKTFIPGFEEKLVGAKVGEVAEFDITFPEDYHAKEFQKRSVYFMTTIFSIEKAKKPEWTEEFIEQIRGAKTDFAGFKDIVKAEILEEKERQARQADEKVLLEKLLEIATIEVGPKLLAHEVEEAWKQFEKYLSQQGMTPKDYLEHSKTDEETYKKNHIETEALKRIKAEIILGQIKKTTDVVVTKEDVEVEVEKIMARFGSDEVKTRLRDMMKEGGSQYQEIESRLKYQKIVDTFFEE